jgi:hypothetical protein
LTYYDAMAQEDHWLPGFNFNVEEWDAKGQIYETLAICRHPRPSPRLVRSRDRGEGRRPLHDPQPDARLEAALGGGLVTATCTIGLTSQTRGFFV